MMMPDKENRPYHIPVLLNSVLEGLNIREDGIYVDLTFGGGGHSAAILSRLGEKGRLIALDRDPEVPVKEVGDEKNKLPFAKDKRFLFIASDFRFLEQHLCFHQVSKVHGILADLGISWAQVDRNYRGFSYHSDYLPDMRMNPGQSLTAARILNEYSQEKLTRILEEYGEIRRAAPLASAIVKERQMHPFSSCRDLAQIAAGFRGKEDKQRFLAKVFQALRMEVNDEPEALKQVLNQAQRLLFPRGRLVVISYHSLEDRIVKNFIREKHVPEDPITGQKKKEWKEITSSPIRPDDEEIRINPRARSARLRIAEKI